MITYHDKNTSEIFNQLETTENGLSSSQVVSHREKYGVNALSEKKKKSTFMVFIEQFKDLLVIILIAAAIISMVSGNLESTIVIFAVIILNAILGTVQHIKAEKSLDSLKSLSAPTSKVIREGKRVEIPSSEVVVGDILFLEAGDMISADGRIFDNFSLQVNESSLTGESISVNKIASEIEEKDIALGDKKNMVFSGSMVTYGRASVVVTGTGMDTEIGKIATLMNETKDKKTPLQLSLDDFSKKLALIILIICAIVFGLSLFRSMPILDSLMFAVALAVAAIPEALSSIVTIVLAIGTQKMAKKNAIIKELKAVESLGSVSIICSDKTGTLTQNKMTVKKVFIDDKILNDNELNLDNELERALIKASVLCNDSVTVDGKELGDPTEIAFVNFAEKYNIDELKTREKIKRLDEIPFDSDRKLMSTLHKINGNYVMFTKGACDVIFGRLTHIHTSNGVRAITKEDIEKIKGINADFSKDGLRVLGFAYRIIKEHCEENELCLDDENNYTFMGLISMIDPPREESKQAVADCVRAGIKPIMITGDHAITASAIAKQIGIFKDGDIAVNGVELDKMTDEQLQQKLAKISVYARVSPEHKIRIVNAWQSRGEIVAMTGDGVNDAPALKKADIGIAMGITGTQVSKDAAAMILTDDNFATIVKAIENGRNVFVNIKNAIKFLLSGNTAGILAVLYTSIFALPMPFTPVHLLFINLLTDSLPAIAIGMEKSGSHLLDQKPRKSNESILSKDFLMKILSQGFLIAIFTMIAFHIGNATDEFTASTMAFSTLCLARLFHSFNCRNQFSIFKNKISTNKYIIYAFLIGVVLLNLVLFVPGLTGLFDIAPLTFPQVGWIYILAFAPTLIIQILKVIRELKKK